MKEEIIIFPKRTDKVKEFTIGKPFDGGMFGTYITMQNGDNFAYYGTEDLKLKVGVELTYTMKKEGGKTKVKDLVVHTKETKALLPYFDGLDLEQVLFLDIETVRLVDKLDVKSDLYASWEYKRRKEGESTAAELKKSFEDKAPLFAEFGKVVCISMGMIKDGKPSVFTLYGDEHELLTKFVSYLGGFQKKFPSLKFSGHSIVDFDLPYLVKRMLACGIRVPKILDFTGIKPWNLDDLCVDTKKIWQGTSFYTASLINLCTVFGVESPKQGIDGSMVSDVYYKKADGLKEIVKYCERDVISVINIVHHLCGKEKFSTFESKTVWDESNKKK